MLSPVELRLRRGCAIIAIIGIIGIIARADQLDAEFRAATGLAEKTEESVSALLRDI